MDNPTIQTDVAQILAEIKEELKTTNNRLSKIEITQAEIIGSINTSEEKLSGQIKSLDTKAEQLNIRVGSIEFAVRGVLVGLAIVVFGGFAMLFWMSNKS
jgi:hypothetical protein